MIRLKKKLYFSKLLSLYKRVINVKHVIIVCIILVNHQNGGLVDDVIGFTDPLLLLDNILHHDNQFRLVLIDYKMPRITGCELANKIADINPGIKMVLITAVNDIIKNKLNLELIHKPLRLH
jgi:CheY-like chemotaxis protein